MNDVRKSHTVYIWAMTFWYAKFDLLGPKKYKVQVTEHDYNCILS